MKIRIGAVFYTVEYADKIIEGDKKLLGECDPDAQSIKISCEQTEEQKLSTLIHEIIEAINIEYGVELKHRQICQLEKALFQVLKDNKHIIKHGGCNGGKSKNNRKRK